MRLEEEQEKLAKNPKNKDAEKYVNYFRHRVKGSKYRGDESVNNNKDSAATIYYRVSSERYYHYYIGHYDPAKYRQQMVKYKNGQRKSRPNGRRWCKPHHKSILKRSP
jgi:hypothetical protein